MKTWMWLGLFLLGTAALSPFVLQAQVLSAPCCHTCLQPVAQCHCLQTRAVVQTQLRQEQVTTYRDVLETRYRQECVVEPTPVTTYEDQVETVWVPQQVTKRVARTVMVPQVKSRTVPYQVMQRIPQTTTRVVPYQTVHHVTEAVPVGVVAAPIVTQAWVHPVPVVAAPPGTISSLPVQSAFATPHRAPPLAPAASSADGWQTIPPRSASSNNGRYGGYEPDSDRAVPTPIDNEPAVRRSSWGGHVPGAASAMNFNGRAYR